MNNLKHLLLIIPIILYYLIESLVIGSVIFFIWKFKFQFRFDFSLDYFDCVFFIWIFKMIFFDVFKINNAFTELTNDEHNASDDNDDQQITFS